MNYISNTSCNQDVQEWLKKVFGNEKIPDFEETEELMQFLRKAMLKNKEAELDAQNIIKAEKRYTEIYNKKADELSTILNAESLDLKSETIKVVEDIAAIGNKLNLKDPTVTNFLFAAMDADNKEIEARNRKFVEEYHHHVLSKKVAEIMKTNYFLKSELEKLKKTVERHEASQPEVLGRSSFFDSKIKNYEFDIKKNEESLTKRNFDSSLEHHRLVQRAESIKELEKELQNLHLQLNNFQSLPPNEFLTSLKIQTAKSELTALKQQFQENLAESSEDCV